MFDQKTHLNLRGPLQKLARESVLIGTSSWKYPCWCRQVYDESRYITRKMFSESRFERDCLTEYADVQSRQRLNSFIDMPNQRQPGTKLAGAYISAEKDAALAKIAAQKGYANKAEFIRVLFDDALAENTQALKKAKPKK